METSADESGQDDATSNEEASTDGEDVSSDSEENDDVWHTLIEYIKRSYPSPKMMDPNANIEEMIDEIRDTVSYFLKTAEAIKESNVYRLIQKTKKNLLKQGYDDDEADKACWEMGKLLVKKEIIEPNL